MKLKYPIEKLEERLICAYRAGQMYGSWRNTKPSEVQKYLKVLKGEKRLGIFEKFIEGFHYQTLRNATAFVDCDAMPAHNCECIAAKLCWDDLGGEEVP